MRTRTTVRILGLVMTILGGSLLIGMGAIALWAVNLIRHNDDPNASSHYIGTRQQMHLMFGVFGFIMLFGLAALAAGLWQLIVGRRNMVLVWIVLGLGVLFFVGGVAFNTFWRGR